MAQPTEMMKFAIKPARWVVFLRTFVPFQIYRFIWVNLRMMRMIFMSHGTEHAPAASRSRALPAESPRRAYANARNGPPLDDVGA